MFDDVCSIFMYFPRIFCPVSPRRRWPSMMDRFSLKRHNIRRRNKHLRPGVGGHFLDAGFIFIWIFVKHLRPKKHGNILNNHEMLLNFLGGPHHFVDRKGGFVAFNFLNHQPQSISARSLSCSWSSMGWIPKGSIAMTRRHCFTPQSLGTANCTLPDILFGSASSCRTCFCCCVLT